MDAANATPGSRRPAASLDPLATKEPVERSQADLGIGWGALMDAAPKRGIRIELSAEVPAAIHRLCRDTPELAAALLGALRALDLATARGEDLRLSAHAVHHYVNADGAWPAGTKALRSACDDIAESASLGLGRDIAGFYAPRCHDHPEDEDRELKDACAREAVACTVPRLIEALAAGLRGTIPSPAESVRGQGEVHSLLDDNASRRPARSSWSPQYWEFLDGQAVAYFISNPAADKTQIAEALGIRRQALYAKRPDGTPRFEKLERVMSAAACNAEQRRAQIPRGRIVRDGKNIVLESHLIPCYRCGAKTQQVYTLATGRELCEDCGRDS